MKIKCPFWPICGAAPIHQCLAQRAFPYGDPRRDYVNMICDDENRYLACEHYKIRKPKEAEKAVKEFYEKKVQKKDPTMEELAQEKKREIIVPIPFTFDSLTKVLRKGGLIVKKSWPNIEPSQEEVDSVITAIEEAVG